MWPKYPVFASMSGRLRTTAPSDANSTRDTGLPRAGESGRNPPTIAAAASAQPDPASITIFQSTVAKYAKTCGSAIRA